MEDIENAGLSNVPLSHVNDNETKHRPPRQHDSVGSLRNLLEQHLPLIMRLFFTQNITDTIECFL